MTSGDLPPEREEQFLTELLRERGGIDPGALGPVLDLAAVGLVNWAWRNTCVEDWYAESRMRDGDMLRVNSHATWRVRQLVRRWAREIGLEATDPTSALEGIAADEVWWLARRLYQWLVNPARKMPTGVTLARLAGDDLPEYEDDADGALSAFGAQAEDREARLGFARTAAHGALACSHWWGTRTGQSGSIGSRRHSITRRMTTGVLEASTELPCPPNLQMWLTARGCTDSYYRVRGI